MAGNRDANKLRLASELHPECLQDPHVLTDTSFPYWVDASKRVTPQMFLDKNDAANGGSDNSAANRLRWMLNETMGAQGAFDRRRHELSVLRACAEDAVSDADVVESYRSEVDPTKEGDNFMLKYLQHGKLAYVFGNCLFVHGAVSARNMGTVPGSTKRFGRVQEWVEALNSWCKQEVVDFVADPFGGKNARNRKGSGLTDYGVPGGNEGATVVYEHNLSNGNGKHIEPGVQAFLLRSGITSVISGHQPHGDCPLVIRTGRVTAITADTSYSEMGHKSSWGVDNRGEKAVSELLLRTDGSSEVRGILADGTGIFYRLPPGGHVPFPPMSAGAAGDVFVGRQLANGFWVKARTIGENPEYVLCRGEGFKLTVERRKVSEMEALTEADFMQNLEVVDVADMNDWEAKFDSDHGWVTENRPEGDHNDRREATQSLSVAKVQVTRLKSKTSKKLRRHEQNKTQDVTVKTHETLTHYFWRAGSTANAASTFTSTGNAFAFAAADALHLLLFNARCIESGKNY